MRLMHLNRNTNEAGSVQDPTQLPFRKILSILVTSSLGILSSLLIPQEMKLSIKGWTTLELTTAVTAKFFTSPQFSPSGVDIKQSFPQ
jgi:hypothetical protein